MTEAQTETAPNETVDGPDTASLLSEVSETTQTEASQEQTATETAQGDPQGEQPVAPESYEFELPEGVTIDKDAAPIAAYSEFAKSLGLPQDKAQEGLTKLVEAQAAHGKSQLDAMVKSWQDETRNDPEIGGEKLPATLVKANQVLATLKSGPALKALLEESKLGNHKAVIAALAEFRDVVGDDRFIAGNEAEVKPKTTAQSFYPNSKMNP